MIPVMEAKSRQMILDDGENEQMYRQEPVDEFEELVQLRNWKR